MSFKGLNLIFFRENLFSLQTLKAFNKIILYFIVSSCRMALVFLTCCNFARKHQAATVDFLTKANKFLDGIE